MAIDIFNKTGLGKESSPETSLKPGHNATLNPSSFDHDTERLHASVMNSLDYRVNRELKAKLDNNLSGDLKELKARFPNKTDSELALKLGESLSIKLMDKFQLNNGSYGVKLGAQEVVINQSILQQAVAKNVSERIRVHIEGRPGELPSLIDPETKKVDSKFREHLLEHLNNPSICSHHSPSLAALALKDPSPLFDQILNSFSQHSHTHPETSELPNFDVIINHMLNTFPQSPSGTATQPIEVCDHSPNPFLSAFNPTHSTIAELLTPPSKEEMDKLHTLLGDKIVRQGLRDLIDPATGKPVLNEEDNKLLNALYGTYLKLEDPSGGRFNKLSTQDRVDNLPTNRQEYNALLEKIEAILSKSSAVGRA